MELIWPLALVVLSNTVYQVCAKGLPSGMDPLASMIVTYLVGALASAVLYLSTSRGGNLPAEIAKTNWAPIVLGLVVVGLEVGMLYAYRNGWQVSMLSISNTALQAAALLLLGYFVYHENITVQKLLGFLLCLAGVVVINL